MFNQKEIKSWEYQKDFGQIVRWCLHISEAPQKDLKFLWLIKHKRSKSTLMQTNGSMRKAETMLLLMHREDLIQERRLQAVDGLLGLHSYRKAKYFGQGTM